MIMRSRLCSFSGALQESPRHCGRGDHSFRDTAANVPINSFLRRLPRRQHPKRTEYTVKDRRVLLSKRKRRRGVDEIEMVPVQEAQRLELQELTSRIPPAGVPKCVDVNKAGERITLERAERKTRDRSFEAAHRCGAEVVEPLEAKAIGLAESDTEGGSRSVVIRLGRTKKSDAMFRRLADRP